MSAATPRTISNAPDLRQLLVAVGALILAVALLVAVTISRQSSLSTTSAPAAVPASVAHDHGWSASSGSQDLVVSTANGGITYTGIPYAAPDTVLAAPAVGEFRLAPGNLQPMGVERATTGIVPAPAVPYVSLPASDGIVVATENGGILYTGIPYPAPETDHQGGSNGTRFPQ
jgi:hypothetical protein